MVSWVPWRLCPWHLLKLCSALYVWWDISHWIQLLGFFNICDYPVFTVLFPKKEKKNTRLIAGGCFILEIIGLFWFPGLNWFVCLCVVCRKRNYIRNLKGLVLQKGDYYMDRALHCCWLLHSDHHLILGWWQGIRFPFSAWLWCFFLISTSFIELHWCLLLFKPVGTRADGLAGLQAAAPHLFWKVSWQQSRPGSISCD